MIASQSHTRIGFFAESWRQTPNPDPLALTRQSDLAMENDQSSPLLAICQSSHELIKDRKRTG